MQTSSAGQRAHPTTVVMLLPVRIFLAAGWLRAGIEKLIDAGWWKGDALGAFIVHQRPQAMPFFAPVMTGPIARSAIVVSAVVMTTEIACGVLLALGKQLRLALVWGCVLNVSFVLAGQVSPSAFYLVMEGVLLLAIADGLIGVNRTTPSLKSLIPAGGALAVAIVCAPYIRTLKPALVITDPAVMLTFLGVVFATTIFVRLIVHQSPATTCIARMWSSSVAGWVHAQPRRHLTPRHSPDPLAEHSPDLEPVGVSPGR